MNLEDRTKERSFNIFPGFFFGFLFPKNQKILTFWKIKYKSLQNSDLIGKACCFCERNSGRKRPEKTTSAIGIFSDEQTVVELLKNRFHLLNDKDNSYLMSKFYLFLSDLKKYRTKIGFEILQNLTTLLVSQIREQMSGPDLHVLTLKFLALKKTGFSPIKNTFQIFFDFCLPLFYTTFQCRP